MGKIKTDKVPMEITGHILRQLPDFDIRQLENFDLGLADGEKDEALKESFIVTKSIRKLLKKKYNYVLSPKGAGKSATFKAIIEKYISPELLDYNKYRFVAINKAFETDNEYLSTQRFKSNLEHKKYTVSWALYIAIKLIETILNDYKDSPYYSKFEADIKKYADFKDKYELYNILDYLEQLNLSLKFSSNGQDLVINPSIKLKHTNKKISLNEIYLLINDFFKKNNVTVKILIDRVDNFVQKEEYQIQKNYLQGLVDCIEEIANLSNIQPLVFLRTDLFYSHTLNFEFDKLADRILNLEWSKDEILFFITRRLLTNSYIKSSFNLYLNYCIENELKNPAIIGTKTKIKKFLDRIFGKNNDFDIKQDINYKIAERFVKLFFSNEVEHFNASHKTEPIELCLWLFTHFVDMNQFINPRIILRFLQLLADKQYETYVSHNILVTPFIKVKEEFGFVTFNIFMCDVIKSVYSQVQNEQLKTIFKLQNTKTTQALFRKFNQLLVLKESMNYGDINLKNFETEKEEFNRFIKYLNLLGYIGEVDTKKYVTSPLYRKELELSIRN